MKIRSFKDVNVERTFAVYPKQISNHLLGIRELIFSIAEKTIEIGELEETLKWESPSYLTRHPKSGTTIRLSGLLSNENKYAISVHCQTTLVSEFKELYSELEYDGNRSLIFDVRKEQPTEVIEYFIYLALTYHYRKKRGIGL